MSRVFDVFRESMGEEGGEAASEALAAIVITFKDQLEAELAKLPEDVLAKIADVEYVTKFGENVLNYTKAIVVAAKLLQAQRFYLARARAAGCDVYCVAHAQDAKLCNPEDHGMMKDS